MDVIFTAMTTFFDDERNKVTIEGFESPMWRAEVPTKFEEFGLTSCNPSLGFP